jgi:hypothetical protein
VSIIHRTHWRNQALNKDFCRSWPAPNARAAWNSWTARRPKCGAWGLVYPVREEIPVMLIDDAVPVARWEQGVRENKA